MFCRVLLVLAVVLVVPLSGCDALDDIIGGNTVTVRLVNQSDFDVDVTLYYYDHQDVDETLLVLLGDEVEYTIGDDDTRSFTQSCDDLQAIMIEDADLQIIGGIGPEANTDVLRDGDDFGCGDTIVFTFDHSDLIFDFEIEVDVE